MNIEKIKQDRRKKPGELANIQVSIRITKSMSKWLRDKKYSPTGIFLSACEELGFKEKD